MERGIASENFDGNRNITRKELAVVMLSVIIPKILNATKSILKETLNRQSQSRIAAIILLLFLSCVHGNSFSYDRLFNFSYNILGQWAVQMSTLHWPQRC